MQALPQQTYVFLLKLRQKYHGHDTDIEYVFRRVSGVYFYLKEVWDYWRANMSAEEWERIPSLPFISEMKAGLNAGWFPGRDYLTYEIATVGSLDDGQPHSLYVSLRMMMAY